MRVISLHDAVRGLTVSGKKVVASGTLRFSCKFQVVGSEVMAINVL